MIVLCEFRHHALYKLKLDLSRPLTFWMVAVQLVEPESTHHTSVAENLQQCWAMPQIAEITIQQCIDQHLEMRLAGERTMHMSDFSLTELPRHQKVLLAGIVDHSHLPDHVAYVSLSILVGAWITSASNAGCQRLQKKSHHLIGSCPEGPMTLL